MGLIMIAFLRQLSMFLAIQAVLFAGWLALDPGDGYLAAAIDKQRSAELTPGPRVLLVGGSNVAFGIDSAGLSNWLPQVQVVNLGLHAGLGFDFLLNQSLDVVREGDLVVISPEYQHFAHHTTSAAAIDLLRASPGHAKHFSLTDWKVLADHGLCYFRASLNRIVGRLLRRPQLVYRREAFNVYGDVVAHHELRPSYAQRPTATTWSFSAERLDDSIARMNRYIDDCKSRGANVVFAFPPLSEAAWQANRSTVETIRQTVGHNAHVSILNAANSPDQLNSHFFDTEYHLTESAKARRTAELAFALQPALLETRSVARR